MTARSRTEALAALGRIADLLKERDLGRLSAARVAEAAAQDRLDGIERAAGQVRATVARSADILDVARGEQVLDRLSRQRQAGIAALALARARMLQERQAAGRSFGRADALNRLARQAGTEAAAARLRRETPS